MHGGELGPSGSGRVRAPGPPRPEPVTIGRKLPPLVGQLRGGTERDSQCRLGDRLLAVPHSHVRHTHGLTGARVLRVPGHTARPHSEGGRRRGHGVVTPVPGQPTRSRSDSKSRVVRAVCRAADRDGWGSSLAAALALATISATTFRPVSSSASAGVRHSVQVGVQGVGGRPQGDPVRAVEVPAEHVLDAPANGLGRHGQRLVLLLGLPAAHRLQEAAKGRVVGGLDRDFAEGRNIVIARFSWRPAFHRRAVGDVFHRLVSAYENETAGSSVASHHVPASSDRSAHTVLPLVCTSVSHSAASAATRSSPLPLVSSPLGDCSTGRTRDWSVTRMRTRYCEGRSTLKTK